MNLTKEQKNAFDAVVYDNKMIAINSKAGCGKTSLSRAIIETVKPIKGFLTAFNKGIVQDCNSKVGKMIPCKTMHSIAWGVVKPKKIDIFNYSSIEEDDLLNFEKYAVISHLDKFYLSKYLSLDEYFEFQETPVPLHIQNIVSKYMNQMLDGKMPVTYNYMLKMLHSALQKDIYNFDLDLFIFEECQDTSPVMLEILKHISAKKKVISGDTFQNIYGFLDTVNAFEKIHGIEEFALTKSFRCGEQIAENVQEFGKEFLHPKFTFTGVNRDPNTIENSKGFLSRTNSHLIKRMYALLQAKQTFSTIRPTGEIFKAPISVFMASIGKTVLTKEYKYLEDEYKKFKASNVQGNSHDFYVHLENNFDFDPEIVSSTSLLRFFNRERVNIFDFKKQIEALPSNKNAVLSTIHASKGLEFKEVILESDVNTAIKKAKEKFISFKNSGKEIPEEVKQEMNLYYVGKTRAMAKLTELSQK